MSQIVLFDIIQNPRGRHLKVPDGWRLVSIQGKVQKGDMLACMSPSRRYGNYHVEFSWCKVTDADVDPNVPESCMVANRYGVIREVRDYNRHELIMEDGEMEIIEGILWFREKK